MPTRWLRTGATIFAITTMLLASCSNSDVNSILDAAGTVVAATETAGAIATQTAEASAGAGTAALRLPYSDATAEVGIGAGGLHDTNYECLIDESGPNAKPVDATNFCTKPAKDAIFYTLNNRALGDASMDLGFYGSSDLRPTTYVLALRDGTVLVRSNTCNAVLIDYGSGLWGIFMHLKADTIVVKRGDTVHKGDKIGIPTKFVSNCYEQSSYQHVHFAFLNSDHPNDPALADTNRSGTYRPMAGMTLCGLTVGANKDVPSVVVSGLTFYKNLPGLDYHFTVPTCP